MMPSHAAKHAADHDQVHCRASEQFVCHLQAVGDHGDVAMLLQVKRDASDVLLESRKMASPLAIQSAPARPIRLFSLTWRWRRRASARSPASLPSATAPCVRTSNFCSASVCKSADRHLGDTKALAQLGHSHASLRLNDFGNCAGVRPGRDRSAYLLSFEMLQLLSFYFRF